MRRPGPTPFFDLQHPLGIPDELGSINPLALAAKYNHCCGIEILRAAATHGKLLFGESPPSRAKGEPHAFSESNYEFHCSAWQFPPMVDFIAD